jgi:uncharacterized OsmC-like protein
MTGHYVQSARARPIATEEGRMTTTATARQTADGLTHDVEVADYTTTAPPIEPSDVDFGSVSHELLAATLATSVATMVASYAEDRGWRLGDTSVEVSYDPDRVPSELVVHTHLPEGLPAEQRARLERVALTCSARRALEGGFDFVERLPKAAGSA